LTGPAPHDLDPCAVRQRQLAVCASGIDGKYGRDGHRAQSGTPARPVGLAAALVLGTNLFAQLPAFRGRHARARQPVRTGRGPIGQRLALLLAQAAYGLALRRGEIAPVALLHISLHATLLPIDGLPQARWRRGRQRRWGRQVLHPMRQLDRQRSRPAGLLPQGLRGTCAGGQQHTQHDAQAPEHAQRTRPPAPQGMAGHGARRDAGHGAGPAMRRRRRAAVVLAIHRENGFRFKQFGPHTGRCRYGMAWSRTGTISSVGNVAPAP